MILKRVVWSPFLLAVLLGLGGCGQDVRKRESVPEMAGDQVLTVEQMREDLEYVIGTLRDVHPQTYHGFSRQQGELIETLRSSIGEPMKAREFYLLAGRLLCSMKDGHTHMWPMREQKNRFANVPLSWLKDGLYVTADSQPFQAGDRIVAIGRRPTGELIEQLGQFIPSENPQWLQYKSADALARETYLDMLGVIRDGQVEWTVQREGKELMFSAGLVSGRNNHSKGSPRHWVGHRIDKDSSLGIFHLDSCYCNDEYKKAVKDFFTEVHKKQIGHIVVDLRRNGGGDSTVVDEFLSYFDIDRYKSFGAEVRRSKASAQQKNSFRTWGRSVFKNKMHKNHTCSDLDLLFKGQLYVLISVETFSSGNWFALIIKDNHLGTIVGEPTGNQPSSYGDILEFQTPNTGFHFSVSFKKFLRPDPANDPADALYPDVTVYTTIEDVLQSRDPQVEKVKKLMMGD